MRFDVRGWRWTTFCVALLLAAWVALPRQAPAAGEVFIVNSDDDFREDGCDARHCNLREAIEAANTAAPADIRFELPAFPYRIELRQPLPALRGGVTLDGASQADAHCPLPVVHVDGSAIQSEVPVVGLEVLGNGNRVQGLVITGFSSHGILVDGNENHLHCLVVGVDPTGTEAQGNDGHGIAVVGGHSNRIGGPSAMDGNLLSANGGRGLYIEDALNTYLAYNGIGIDVLGEPRLPNGDADLPPINPPPEPPNERNERASAARIKAAERRIASIIEKQGRALEKSGLYEKYVLLIRTDRGAPPPADLSELLPLLARQPELYGAFAAEASAILEEARYEAAVQLDRLGRAVRQSVPTFGRVPQHDHQVDVQAHTLSVYAPSDYVQSGLPSEIVAVEDNTGPPTQQPLWWHSLTTYGPTEFDQKYGGEWIPDPLTIQTCLSVAIGLPVDAACYWPVMYDLQPWSMQLTWQSPSLTKQQIEDIVQENGYRLELWVNGKQLNIGPPPLNLQPPPDSSGGDHGSNVLPGQGFYAASLPGRRSPGSCPEGRMCLATTVLIQDALANVPRPWIFEIKVKKLEDLDVPIVVGIDHLGNTIVATHTAKPIAHVSRTVLPNPETGGLGWFTETLYPTFKHPRCADCHGFGNFENIAIHHTSGNIQEWIDKLELHLEPSLYVPGAHVMVCNNCHLMPLQDNFGNKFYETEWVAPYHDLKVDWAQQNAAQICGRVKFNLPSHMLRFIHFHRDARLYWAVKFADLPSGVTLETAPPNGYVDDFVEFLRRVDIWNDFGAPCP